MLPFRFFDDRIASVTVPVNRIRMAEMSNTGGSIAVRAS